MIPHNKPTIGITEIEASRHVLSSGWLAQGEQVAQFENEFCEYIGLPKGHAVAVSSGTAALYLALWSLDAAGKRIAFPAYVCAAVRNAVGMIDGHEVLIDNSPRSPNLDVESLNSVAPEIVIVPHMYGIPANVTRIKGPFVIEDCCQSLGSKISKRSLGLYGDVGIYSFYATKVITSGGQGGMIVSTNRDRVDKIRDYQLFDQRHDWRLRFNFQMTDLQAAIGRCQLKQLPQFLERRNRIFTRYQDAGLDLLDSEIKGASPIRYRSVLRTKKAREIMTVLETKKIKTIIPTEDWELLGDRALFPHAYALTQETLSLPTYPSLTDQELNYIIEQISSIL